LLIQGVVKGQQHGAYTLNDASLLHKAITFVSSSLQQASQPQASQPQASQPQASQPQASQPQASQPQEDDLSDLAEPIPLKPKEV